MTNPNNSQAHPQGIELMLGDVMHQRMRPKMHRFDYSLFYCRLPLRALERQAWDTKLNLFSRNRFNLISFYDKDHTRNDETALQWVTRLLHESGIDDADGEIWLQCFPRILGYVFNPVSFWYCENQAGQVRAIVCEVSNTFGERHIYLLQPTPGQTRFSVRKVFHVSPFCEVRGHYEFHFPDIEATMKDDSQARRSTPKHLVQIDYHDHEGALLYTYLKGRPTECRDWKIAQLCVRFPLMSLMVMWRIHWQALRLWLKKTPFYSKPPAPVDEVSQ